MPQSLRAFTLPLLLAIGPVGVACSKDDAPGPKKPSMTADPQPAETAPPSASADASGATDDSELPALTDAARGKVKRFAGSLKGELMSAMKAGGPAAAVDVCNTRAGELAATSSLDGWSVGRRSTRLRNADNAPDDWESAALEAFAAQLSGGGAPEHLERAEIIEADGARRFRYAKGIVLGGECLTCHGSEVAPELRAKITSLYPGDAATGYAAGELRGIFSLTKQL